MNFFGRKYGQKIYIQLRFILELNILLSLLKVNLKKVGAPLYESLSQEFSVTCCSSVMKMITIKRPLRE